MLLRLHKEDVCINETEDTYVFLEKITKSFNKDAIVVSDLTMEVKKGEFFSLLGPSGCGKTTVLRLIAGLEIPDQGNIMLGGNVASGKTWIPPEQRSVGIVFQDYALFPHMTVFKNVAFGLKGYSRQELKKEVMGMLDMVDLSGFSQRYPHELSGGQGQRVALIRALAPSPIVMLLDEPFSNLDTDLRDELASDTKKILKEKGTTAILVTHDQKEAFSLSDRVGVLNHGRLEQVGTPEEIYHTPLNRFIAGFTGKVDFIPGKITDNSIVSDMGVFKLNNNNNISSKHRKVDIMIRPEDVDFTVDPAGSATVANIKFFGAEIIYQIHLADGRIIHAIKSSINITPVGSKIKLTVNPTHIVVFPDENLEKLPFRPNSWLQ